MKATLRNRNLFIRAHEAQHGSDFDRIGSGWENTLTDEFAFLLAADNEARESVIKAILGTEAEPVSSIDTQVGFESGCPDLQIEFESGRLLLLEHKVDASLGHEQLERYLRIKDENGRPAWVALISRKHTQVAENVLGNKNYIRPTGGSHWYWTDVYGWLPKSNHSFGTKWVRQCFREYLELLGFSPSDLAGRWKELLSGDLEFNHVRDEFGRRLFQIRALLSEEGFRIVGDSHSGLTVSHPERETPYLHFTVGPARVRRDQMDPEHAHKVTTAVFRVALVYDTAEIPTDAVERFGRLDSVVKDANGFDWYRVAPHRMTNRRTRLSMVSSLSQFLEDEPSIAERLFRGFVSARSALCAGEEST